MSLLRSLSAAQSNSSAFWSIILPQLHSCLSTICCFPSSLVRRLSTSLTSFLSVDFFFVLVHPTVLEVKERMHSTTMTTASVMTKRSESKMLSAFLFDFFFIILSVVEFDSPVARIHLRKESILTETLEWQKKT